MSGNRKLGKRSDQRKAMLRAMVTYLLENGQIKTTLARAKWGDLKRYHLSLNTSPIGKEGGADLIVQYAKLRRAKLGL